MSEVLADTTSASVDSEGNIHDASNVRNEFNPMQYGTFKCEYWDYFNLFKIILDLVHLNDTRAHFHIEFIVLETLPHDSSAFTQGVSFFDGYLYEGTGLYGSSELRKLDPKDPKNPLQTFSIPSEFFGEGITHYRNAKGEHRLIQLTWKEGQALVYDAKKLKVLFSFEYHIESSNGEGWGITFDSQANEFIVSDGSTSLFFWDVAEIDDCEVEATSENEKVDEYNEIRLCDVEVEPRRSVTVQAFVNQSPDPIPVQYLNELEFVASASSNAIGGSLTHTVLANIWFQEYILEIDPKSGNVLKLFDLSSLCPERSPRGENVLNGISISEDGDRVLYVTGKNWDSMYKIILV